MNHDGAIRRYFDKPPHLEELNQHLINLLYVRLFLRKINDAEWTQLINNWIYFKYKDIPRLHASIPRIQELIHEALKTTVNIDIKKLFLAQLKNLLLRTIKTPTHSNGGFSVNAAIKKFNDLIALYKDEFPQFPFDEKAIKIYGQEAENIQKKINLQLAFRTFLTPINGVLLISTLLWAYHNNPYFLIFSTVLGVVNNCLLGRRLAKTTKAVKNAAESVEPQESLKSQLAKSLTINYESDLSKPLKFIINIPNAITQVVNKGFVSSSTHKYLLEKGLHPSTASVREDKVVATTTTAESNYKLHYKNEIYLRNNDYALLDMESKYMPKEEIIIKTFNKGLNNKTTELRHKNTGIVPMIPPYKGHIYKMNIIGNTKARCYATMVIQHPNGDRTFVFNYYSTLSHDTKRFNVPPIEVITPEQWQKYLAARASTCSSSSSTISALSMAV